MKMRFTLIGECFSVYNRFDWQKKVHSTSTPLWFYIFSSNRSSFSYVAVIFFIRSGLIRTFNAQTNLHACCEQKRRNLSDFLFKRDRFYLVQHGSMQRSLHLERTNFRIKFSLVHSLQKSPHLCSVHAIVANFVQTSLLYFVIPCRFEVC